MKFILRIIIMMMMTTMTTVKTTICRGVIGVTRKKEKELSLLCLEMPAHEHTLCPCR